MSDGKKRTRKARTMTVAALRSATIKISATTPVLVELADGTRVNLTGCRLEVFPKPDPDANPPVVPTEYTMILELG